MIIKTIVRRSVLLVAAVAAFGAAHAQTQEVGVRAGAVMVGSDADLAVGAQFLTVPYAQVGLQVDLSTAFSGDYFSFTPALVFLPIGVEELRAGLLGGAGFTRLKGDDTRFSLVYGLLGSFALESNMSIGMELRSQTLLGSDLKNPWTVFLTFGYRFGSGGDW